MNLCNFKVVDKWTPIVLILDHILQVPLTTYQTTKSCPVHVNLSCQTMQYHPKSFSFPLNLGRNFQDILLCSVV